MRLRDDDQNAILAQQLAHRAQERPGASRCPFELGVHSALVNKADTRDLTARAEIEQGFARSHGPRLGRR
jgi:hypothetical protein